MQNVASTLLGETKRSQDCEDYHVVAPVQRGRFVGVYSVMMRHSSATVTAAVVRSSTPSLA